MKAESGIPDALIHHGKFFKTEKGFASHRERLYSKLLKQAEQYDQDYLTLINEMSAIDIKLTVIRMQMMNEIEALHSAEHQPLKAKMMAVDTQLYSHSRQVEKISKDIERIKVLKDRLIEIQLKKDDIRAKKVICAKESNKLTHEIKTLSKRKEKMLIM
ncbi:hypothetical protein SAMN02746073_2752 [Legionella jamestowniensis DSM 19215]|uniref:Coiled-coil protein n=2 Tax=Legionella jamestowniensis TaxID=455 RepID=A0A0W0UH84_9GAMM|nr:hypothetical protein Ljam_1464 [Legionella jamestowniensis]SFL95390.1 hypothetical protein SAMN02746073_2752 [Legionella jamestowniensis DSM 19215]